MDGSEMIILGIIFATLFAGGLSLGANFLAPTPETDLETKELWLLCGENWNNLETILGEEFEMDVKLAGCEAIIEILCDECEKV